jgi:hypothetical protein
MKKKFQGVYKVLAFDNDDAEAERVDLTDEFLKRGALTVDELRILTPFRDWRVEVRYAIDGETFRVVTYNADVESPPPIPKKNVAPPSMVRALRYPLSATLSTADDVDGSRHGIDATAHVQKFAGPMRDWHGGRSLKMKHMFVGDDPETKALWYPYLHMRTMEGLRSYRIDN